MTYSKIIEKKKRIKFKMSIKLDLGWSVMSTPKKAIHISGDIY